MLADTRFGVDFSGDVATRLGLGRAGGARWPTSGPSPTSATLVRDPALPGLASVICDFAGLDGEPLPICPRGMLKRMVARLEGHGLSALVAPEIEFSVFEEPIQQARDAGLSRPDAARRGAAGSPT